MSGAVAGRPSTCPFRQCSRSAQDGASRSTCASVGRPPSLAETCVRSSGSTGSGHAMRERRGRGGSPRCRPSPAPTRCRTRRGTACGRGSPTGSRCRRRAARAPAVPCTSRTVTTLPRDGDVGPGVDVRAERLARDDRDELVHVFAVQPADRALLALGDVHLEPRAERRQAGFLEHALAVELAHARRARRVTSFISMTKSPSIAVGVAENGRMAGPVGATVLVSLRAHLGGMRMPASMRITSPFR